MNWSGWKRWITRVILIVVALASVAAAFFASQQVKWGIAAASPNQHIHRVEPPSPQKIDADTLLVPAEVAKSLGLRTIEAPSTAKPRNLPAMNGVLALDSNRLGRIHARFAGEVVALGTVLGGEAQLVDPEPSADRPLRDGDSVKKGQLLAVLWSKDLGEKKSELIDLLSKLKLDRIQLDRLRSASAEAISERALREAERNVDFDLINVSRVERTLRSWRLTDEEIASIRTEADEIKPQGERGDYAQWARVELRSPLDGVILEKNLTVGDLVDTSADLFKIADLSRLKVWAYCYEEELPMLQKLPKPIAWTIQLPAVPNSSFRGELEEIKAVIDPAQHTALVAGRVDNHDGALKVGQFVTVTIQAPPLQGEIEVPTTSLVEDGRTSIIFVQPDPAQEKYVRRKVEIARRFHDVVYVKSGVGLTPGERVVSSGAVLLNGALEDLPTVQ